MYQGGVVGAVSTVIFEFLGGGVGAVVVVPDIPGLEARHDGNRLHARHNGARMHARCEWQALHATHDGSRLFARHHSSRLQAKAVE